MGGYFSRDQKTEEDAQLKQKVQELENTVQNQSMLIELLKSKLQDNDVNIKTNCTHFIDEFKKIKQDRDWENLVVSGGGVKGISLIGCLTVLEKEGILKKLKGFAGASVGSLIAALLAIQYTPEEIYDLLNSLHWTKFVTEALNPVVDVYRFVEDYGMYPGTYLYELLGQIIEKKTGNPDYTIKQLYDEKHIKLVITVTNMNKSCSEYIYPDNPIKEFSDIPIRQAIRMSISIPFFFEPVLYNGDYYVDGGLLDNYPLHVFDGKYPGDKLARLNLCDPNPKTLGIKIMTSDEELNYNIQPRVDLSNLVTFSCQFISAFMTQNMREIMVPSYWIRTINIVTYDYPLPDFMLTDKDKQDLIEEGVKYTNEWFI